MSLIITKEKLRTFERFYRGNLINSLSGFKSVSLIGTCNEDGQTNLAIFSNIVHLGADPALIGFVNRPVEAAPHTISNIENTGWYTINHIQHDMINAAHQTSAKYPTNISEFDACNLTAQLVDGIPAPFVKESKVKYALSLVEIIPITHNETFFVIGEIQYIRIENEIVDEDGFLNLEQSGTITSLGIDGYYETKLITRLPYAKP
jgi:flavin reductase (DIM6/NTAB) family NADH-FMN oxidoreductase RutF